MVAVVRGMELVQAEAGPMEDSLALVAATLVEVLVQPLVLVVALLVGVGRVLGAE